MGRRRGGPGRPAVDLSPGLCADAADASRRHDRVRAVLQSALRRNRHAVLRPRALLRRRRLWRGACAERVGDRRPSGHAAATGGRRGRRLVCAAARLVQHAPRRPHLRHDFAGHGRTGHRCRADASRLVRRRRRRHHESRHRDGVSRHQLRFTVTGLCTGRDLDVPVHARDAGLDAHPAWPHGQRRA